MAQIQKENIPECLTKQNILDTFINDLHETYFKQGDQNESVENYTINKTHNLKIRAYPSSFSTEENPIHFYTKLTDSVTYGNWWEQYVMDAWAIDDMFELINLQQYHRNPCENNTTVNTENKVESEQCKKYKRKKALSEVNKVHDFKHTENIKINKILTKK